MMPCPLSPMEPGQTAPSVPAPLRYGISERLKQVSARLSPLVPPMIFSKKNHASRCSQPGPAPRKVAFIELASATSSRRPVRILIPQKGQFMTLRHNSTESARRPEKRMSLRLDAGWPESEEGQVGNIKLEEEVRRRRSNEDNLVK